jgi:hypothetical protein
MKYVFETDGQLYVLRDDSGSDSHYRLLAHPTQVPLMAKLAYEEPDLNVEIISTSIVDAANLDALGADLEKIKFEQKLMRVTEAMRNASDHSPDRGGWRPLTIPESAALQLSYAVCIGNIAGLEFAGQFHPVLSSGGGFAVADQFNGFFISIMANTYDILRFNVSEHVNQNRKLFFEFCGLEESSVFKDFFNAKDFSIDRVSNHRASCALHSWFWNLDDAPMFLTRCIAEPEDSDEPEYVRVFKATRMFVDFIRQIWLSVITGVKFVPETFFHHEEDVVSFKKYIKKLNKKIDNHSKAQ